jgi:hypothetical protein
MDDILLMNADNTLNKLRENFEVFLAVDHLPIFKVVLKVKARTVLHLYEQIETVVSLLHLIKFHNRMPAIKRSRCLHLRF